MKILLCKIKSICYGSTFYFSEQLKKAFEEYGCQVDIFDADKTPLDQLEQYEGAHYDAIIDFNSILPSIETDDNDYFLNTIDAPFYNYILDHPIYHHDMLKKEINNYNVICLDEFHYRYIQNNYTHIKNILLMPLGTNLGCSHGIPFRNRKNDILFTGTYTDPDKAASLISSMGPTLSSDMFELADIMMLNPALTIEEAAKILFDRGVPYINYTEHMKVFFMVDTYITAYFRMQLLNIVACTGLKMTILGDGWNHSPLSALPNVNIMSSIPFNNTLDEMGCSKVLINSMPWFKGGLHDRVISAMSRHALSFSDNSTYLEKHFTNKKDIVTFPTENMSQCPELLLNLFESPDEMEKIAENGYNNVSLNHLWTNRAEYFINQLSSACK